MPTRRIVLTLLLVALLPAGSVVARNQAGSIRFVDVAQKSGVVFQHVSSPEKRYIVESMSGGLALVDFDSDGYLDIFLVNSLTVDLVKSKGHRNDH